MEWVWESDYGLEIGAERVADRWPLSGQRLSFVSSPV